MGLTYQSTGRTVSSTGRTVSSTGRTVSQNSPLIKRATAHHKIIALAGNPNVGKSTVFNCLTGLNQHTGNWPGKTVTSAQGEYRYRGKDYTVVDIPGTYSLEANSREEEAARDFICFADPDAVVIVTDATCLERNLNLVLQTLEITNKVIVCVNLLDEAAKKKISIDLDMLSRHLGVPVVGTSARSGKGIENLQEAVYELTWLDLIPTPLKISYDPVIEEAVKAVEPAVNRVLGSSLNNRWAALKLLDDDTGFKTALSQYCGMDLTEDGKLAAEIKKARQRLRESGVSPNRLKDKVVTRLVRLAEEICRDVVRLENKSYNSLDQRIDSILTSKIFGLPVMLGLLSLVFWLTITGANYPSELLANLFLKIEERLDFFFSFLHVPPWIHGLLIAGVYRTLTWVVSVMLPPMAIFFPLFTLLEDLGYLPRVAFNLDNFFKKACAHGKQALTMCMGFGCNAAGVIGCRIIDSPRERLIAIITNNFVPCNGRFPTLIAVISMFFIGTGEGRGQTVTAAAILTALIVVGVATTLAVSRILSHTILRGLPSSFALELPPYRRPQVVRVLVRSIFDRTLFVLGRAVTVAAPAGLVIWLLANTQTAAGSLLDRIAAFLQPLAHLAGMDGYILLAFILGFPANEIVIPLLIMSYMSAEHMIELKNLEELRLLFLAHGWNALTALCVMLFSLLHFPCATTCLTIRKETGSIKWTLLSFLIPTFLGLAVCFIVAFTARMLGLA